MINSEEKIYANMRGWSDVEPFEVIERRTENKLIVRAMSATLDPDWKPEFVVGGFAGHCTNQSSQRWIITPNEGGHEFAIRKNNKGKWMHRAMRFELSDKPVKFYDYNF